MEKLSLWNDPLDPMAGRLGYLLRRASAAMMADLGDALGAIGLRPVEATILILLGASPGCIQSDLGRTLGIQRANMAPIISSLAERGYITKSPIDGRSIALSLTEQGENARDHANAIMDAHEARFRAMISDLDEVALHQALARIAGLFVKAEMDSETQGAIGRMS